MQGSLPGADRQISPLFLRLRPETSSLAALESGNPAGDTFQILMQTFAIMGKSINSLALREAEFVVRPPLSGVKSADFGARRRAIEAGRSVMLAMLPQLRSRIAAFERGE